MSVYLVTLALSRAKELPHENANLYGDFGFAAHKTWDESYLRARAASRSRIDAPVPGDERSG